MFCVSITEYRIVERRYAKEGEGLKLEAVIRIFVQMCMDAGLIIPCGETRPESHADLLQTEGSGGHE